MFSLNNTDQHIWLAPPSGMSSSSRSRAWRIVTWSKSDVLRSKEGENMNHSENIHSGNIQRRGMSCEYPWNMNLKGGLSIFPTIVASHKQFPTLAARSDQVIPQNLSDVSLRDLDDYNFRAVKNRPVSFFCCLHRDVSF